MLEVITNNEDKTKKIWPNNKQPYLTHTGRFDSNFSHSFKSNTKFELLHEHRP